MNPKIFITRILPQLALDTIKEVFELRINSEDRVLTKTEIIEGVKWCDILLCLLTDTIDKDIITVNPNLKGIVNYAVGYNNISVKTATLLKIPVTNTPGVLTETTADLAWSLICAVARRTVEADKFVRAGKFKGWGPMLCLGGEINGKTLGIIGAGRIGSAVTKRALGFNMKVIYTNKNTTIEKGIKAEKVELIELLKRSDFVSLHVPLVPSTKHLIGEYELKMMKKTAYLINTSRGPVVNEKALVKALQEDQIAGAGLDVYENEPKLTEGLTECKNAVLLPHVGSGTIETRTNMGMIAAENAIAIIKGYKAPQVVNPEIYG